MSINIQMNIKNESGYEELYPKTLGSNIEGKVNNASTASALDHTLTIGEGGTGASTRASAIYTLLNGLTNRTSEENNTYATNTYLGCVYGTSGYKTSIANLMTYINNNVKQNSAIKIINYTGTGVRSLTITTPSRSTMGSLYPSAFTFGYFDESGVQSEIYACFWGRSELGQTTTISYYRQNALTSLNVKTNASSLVIDTDSGFYFNKSGIKYFIILLYLEKE